MLLFFVNQFCKDVWNRCYRVHFGALQPLTILGTEVDSLSGLRAQCSKQEKGTLYSVRLSRSGNPKSSPNIALWSTL